MPTSLHSHVSAGDTLSISGGTCQLETQHLWPAPEQLSLLLSKGNKEAARVLPSLLLFCVTPRVGASRGNIPLDTTNLKGLVSVKLSREEMPGKMKSPQGMAAGTWVILSTFIPLLRPRPWPSLLSRTSQISFLQIPT